MAPKLKPLTIILLMGLVALTLLGELCLADMQPPPGRFYLAEAADYATFVSFGRVIMMMMTALGGLVFYTHKTTMSFLSTVCDIKHKAVDGEFDDVHARIDTCGCGGKNK